MARPKETFGGTLHVEELTDELQCPICNDQLKNPKYLHCFHTYCENCLRQLAKKQKALVCPLCREKTCIPIEGVEGLKTNLMALNLVEKLTSKKEDHGSKGSPEGISKIAEDINSKLRACRRKAEKSESIKETINNRFVKVRSELKTKTDLVVSRVVEKSQKVSNTLVNVEKERLESVKQNIAKIRVREKRLLEASETVTQLLQEEDIKNGCDGDQVSRKLQKLLQEEEDEDDSDLEHIEVSTAGLSELLEVLESTPAAEVYGDTVWTLYATTKQEESFEGARGVAIDDEGYIVIADSKPDSSHGVVGIEWSEVEKFLAVDETFPREEEDEFELDDINEYEEAARDVAIVADDRVAVACADKEIDVYDIEDGEHIHKIPPPNPSSSLWALAVDQNQALFIGNGASNEISRHEKKRKPVTIQTNLKPSFIAANSNILKILVSNWRECRVDVINYEGQSLFSISSRGPRGVLRPTGVCFHGDDNIYIVHREKKPGDGEVHRYNSADGSHVGVAVTGLENPHGVCVGYGAYMVVADWKEVKVFKRQAITFTSEYIM